MISHPLYNLCGLSEKSSYLDWRPLVKNFLKFLHVLSNIISTFIPIFISAWFYLIWFKTLMMWNLSSKLKNEVMINLVSLATSYESSSTLEFSFPNDGFHFTLIGFPMLFSEYVLLMRPKTCNISSRFIFTSSRSKI